MEKFTLQQAMTDKREVEVQLYSFFNQESDGRGWSHHAQVVLPLGKRPDTQCTVDWVGPRPVLMGV